MKLVSLVSEPWFSARCPRKHSRAVLPQVKQSQSFRQKFSYRV